MGAMERMNTLDAEFYFAEHEHVPLHIGSVVVFEGPAPSHAELIKVFEAKLPLVPRYRQVVRTTPFNLFRPFWADDDNFEVSYHVRHIGVPSPGGAEQLRELAERLFAQPLDRTRPLWEEWLIDGLEDGRWAVLSKIHHCMVDGVGGTDVMTLIFGTEPDAKPLAVVPWRPAPAANGVSLMIGGLADLVTWPVRQLAEARKVLQPLGSLDGLLNFGRGLSRSVQWLSEPSASSLNGPIGPHRRWAWTTAPLSQVKQIRAARGGTLNDVLLAVVASAFRDLLRHRGLLQNGGELTADLVVRSLVPVSVRSEDERGVVTNRVSAVLVNLPVSEPDPGQRLALIREQMDSLKRTSQAISAEVLTGMLGFTGPLWLALGSRAAFGAPQPLLQTVVTNVPGPRVPLYILGRRMEADYPYVPIGNSVRLSVAIFSYLDTFSFGLTADHDAVPDLAVFLDGIGRGLTELGKDE
jgi:WS/DGAT/MGAT family acyltransferase